jgi:hypothetical protein
MKIIFGYISVLALWGSTTALVYGQTATTVTAGNWGTAANWSTGSVPTSTTPVIVNNAMTLNQNISVQAKYIFNANSSGSQNLNMSSDSLIINANVSFNSAGNNLSNGVIVVKSGFTFTIGSIGTGGTLKVIIEPGATMIVNGSINNNGGTFQVDGTLNVTGSYSAANGSANVTGSGTFTTTGGMTSMNGGTIFGNPNQSCSSNCDGSSLCGNTASITPVSSAVCAGDNASLSSSSSITPTAYIWQSSPTNGSFTTIAGASTNAYSAALSTASYYRLQVITSGCTTSTAAVHITVNPLPVAPTAGGVARCGNGTVTLTASGSSANYNWYSDAAATNLLVTNANYTTPVLTTLTSYYVNAIDGVTSCKSAVVTVTATITSLPAAPSASDVARCGPGSVTLNATGSAGTYNWYLDALGTNLLSSGSSYSPSISSNTGYYVSSVVSTCESSLTLVNASTQSCTGVLSGSDAAKGIAIYASGKNLYIDASNAVESLSEYKIYDTQGQVMRTGNSFDQHGISSVNLDNMQTGIYMVRIKMGETSVSGKVFVE